MKSGECMADVLLEVRRALFFAKKEDNFKNSLKKKKQRLKLYPDETEADFEIRKIQVENDFINDRKNVEFDDYWYPDYWLVFVYMGKPSSNPATAFYTTPIINIPDGVADSENSKLTGRANRRHANMIAASSKE
jgi:hypothetical protein